jgi:hypothetical protein
MLALITIQQTFLTNTTQQWCTYEVYIVLSPIHAYFAYEGLDHITRHRQPCKNLLITINPSPYAVPSPRLESHTKY